MNLTPNRILIIISFVSLLLYLTEALDGLCGQAWVCPLAILYLPSLFIVPLLLLELVNVYLKQKYPEYYQLIMILLIPFSLWLTWKLLNWLESIGLIHI